MSTTPTVALSVLLASAAAAAVSFASRPGTAPAPAESTDLQQELTALRGVVADLKAQLEAVRTAPAVATSSGDPQRSAAMPTDEQLLAAVDAAMKRRDAAKGKVDAVAPPAGFDLDRDFGPLVGTNYWNNMDAWKKAFAAGKLKDVLARFEAAAKAAPNDPKAHMDLANAYLAALQLDPGDYSRSRLADQELDRVLGIDSTHWEARFTKAVSYTFWPDFLGKKKDAISHFETLVKQQDAMPAEDYQAQTYLYLGNLLEQSDPAKAKEMWQKGARRHPNNAELRAKAGG